MGGTMEELVMSGWGAADLRCLWMPIGDGCFGGGRDMVALLLLRLRLLLLLLLFVGVPWGLVTPSAAGAVSTARKD